GGVFPPGLLIGNIKDFRVRELDGQAQLIPAVDLTKLKAVSVVVGRKEFSSSFCWCWCSSRKSRSFSFHHSFGCGTPTFPSPRCCFFTGHCGTRGSFCC